MADLTASRGTPEGPDFAQADELARTVEQWAVDEGYAATTTLARAYLALRSPVAPSGEPPKECNVFEYDGAFRCVTHGRTWGAITNPTGPCPELTHPAPPLAREDARDTERLNEFDALVKREDISFYVSVTRSGWVGLLDVTGGGMKRLGHGNSIREALDAARAATDPSTESEIA